MKLSIHGNRLYVDGLQFSHAVGRELLHVDGLGWMGADDSCTVRVGRVVNGLGEVMPCSVTETRLIGMANFTAEQGKTISLEIERG